MKTSRLIPFVLPVVAAAMIATAQTRPAEKSRAEGTTRPATIVRLYDIADLTHRPPDYLAGWNKESDERSAGFRSDDDRGEWLMDFIGDSVAPESWRVNGGDLGLRARDSTNTTLVVEQSPANQEAIARLLAELRARPAVSTMVSTRATWLLIDDKDVRAMQAQARRSPPPGATSGPLVVDDATLDRAEMYAAAQTTCFDGQTVSLASQRSWSIVTDVNPVVGTGAVGYDPTTERASSGATLQLTPRLTPDGAAIVDLRSVVTETRPPATRPAVATRPTEGFETTMIDPQDIATQQIATTARLPLGKRVIVAGTTLPPSVGGERGGRTLYLVLEVDAVR